MTEGDQRELLRLRDLLQVIDRNLDSASLKRKALGKADLALSYAFNDGGRSEIEYEYAWIQNLRKRTE